MQDTDVTGQLLMKRSFCEKKLLMIYMKLRRASTHSMRAPKTKRIQASIQASIAVRPSALVGAFGENIMETSYLWSVRRDCVEDVDEHKEEGD